ncbi:N-formylglutamate amidohydrolase [Puniceibacterium confluentis]|uniref:N-formylglutamate amidohydrolase n=1 Tax=Puniceibacterium confluentis TaxID=1958944 RepID=UPI0011B4B9CC|nr:N-formylglutamate amidohydrolase [Puniceibacterium confluentis]
MTGTATPETPVCTVRPGGSASDIVLVCEHASAFIPAELNALGLSEADQKSHAAWDPGALAVAGAMAASLDCALVASTISRLVYDCNRPPEAQDAMPAQSERVVVPGNADLGAVERAARTQRYYLPFRAAVADQITARTAPVLVTIHSFTPVYHGQPRAVEIGILHDADSRLADAMLESAAQHTQLNTLRNAPYGPGDGVTHTLREHALVQGHRNVMIEIRNDLIATPETQDAMAAMLCGWLTQALARVSGGQDA